MLSRARRQGFYVQAALPAPALLIVAGAIVFPLALELWYSLSDAQVGQLGHFVGLANYAYLLHQPTYHGALLNTFVYAVASITIKAILGMAVALAVARHFPGRRLVYALLFLPFVFPMTMGTMAWYYLLSNVHGALNYILMQSKLVPNGVDWLGSFGPLPMASLITVNVWHETGLFAVLLLAGLRSVSSEMIDSARVDGATGSQASCTSSSPSCSLRLCWERRSRLWGRSAISPSSMS